MWEILLDALDSPPLYPPKWKKYISGSFEGVWKKIQAIRAKEAYQEKLDLFLDAAKNIVGKWYKYGHTESGKDSITQQPVFVCDTLVKYLFRKSWSDVLRDIRGANSIFLYFSPSQENIISSQKYESFLVDWKQLNSGDLIFFVDNQWYCGHLAVFSRFDELGGIWIYDATRRSWVAERKLWFDEAVKYSLYYTSPVFTE